MLLKPDPTFYASPKDAINAPPETLAYVALLSASGNGVPDRIGVIDTDSTSPRYAYEAIVSNISNLILNPLPASQI